MDDLDYADMVQDMYDRAEADYDACKEDIIKMLSKEYDFDEMTEDEIEEVYEEYVREEIADRYNAYGRD